MLTRVQIARYDNGSYANSIDIEAGLPSGEGGFSFTDVKGLGPVKSIIASSSYASVDGGVIHSARGDMRNIVVEAELHPDYRIGKTVDQVREELYAHVMPGRQVRVRLYKDGVYVKRIDGTVESVEPVIFSKTPEMQISILCANPDFFAPSTYTRPNLGDEAQGFDYAGNVDAGITATIKPKSTTAWVEIQKISEDATVATQTLRVNGPFPTSQHIRIRTHPGAKEVLVRSASTGSLIRRLTGAAVVGSSGWPVLNPGYNLIRVRGTSVGDVEWDHLVNVRYGAF